MISEQTHTFLKQALVWDNHACMPLRPGDAEFLPKLERVRASGINVISLNVGYDVVDPRKAFLMLATFRHWLRAQTEQYLLVDTVEDIEAARASGRLAVVFDLEGVDALAAHPGLVELFYRSGVRWMLLAYGRNNPLAGGCLDEDMGLTNLGRQIIDEMAKVGMVLCCTHVGHRTALEAMEYSRNPVIFSHSNPARVYPHARNIPDKLMHACAQTGGVVNINGVGLFLGQDAQGRGDNRTETLLRHIDYAVQLIGPDHVGLGLDYVFDLADLENDVREHPEKFPEEVRRPGTYTQVEPERIPAIAEGLLTMGYRQSEVQGILGGNNLRVARQVWK